MRQTDEYYVRPQAAWERIKAAKRSHQTVYIYGTTGSGKTSFVVDYLGRRRYCYIDIADTGMEELEETIHSIIDNAESKEKSNSIVVIDNLYVLENNEEQILCGQLIERMSSSKAVWLILISRAPVPKWLKPVFVRSIMLTIGEKELCLSKKEQESYYEKWQITLTQTAADRARKLCAGHPLALKIGAMLIKSIPKEELTKDKNAAELHAIEEAMKNMWDYLEVHVYDQWSEELQEFLQALSIVEHFDLRLAQQITGKKESGKLILRAQEVGNFLMEYSEGNRNVYEMIAPVKTSMRRRLLTKYSQDYIRELYYSAGNYYEIEGNVTEALRMYEMCNYDEGISRILIENSRRNPAVGNYFELRHYYLALPEENIKEKVELMSGMCMLQSLLLNVEESERWYEELAVFEKEQLKADLYFLIYHFLTGEVSVLQTF